MAARRSYGPIDRNVGKEARTRGFASLALARFAFVDYENNYVGTGRARQFGDVHTVT